jgi:hypothetical protein
VFYRAGISDDLRRCLRLRWRNSPAWRLFGWGKKGDEIEERAGFREGESSGWLLALGSGASGGGVVGACLQGNRGKVREESDEWGQGVK